MAWRTDIEDRKRAEDALRRSEAYLAEAQRLSKTGCWAFRPGIAKPVYWSEEMFRIWGVRSLFKREEITREVLDINEVIADTVSLIREEADRNSIPVRTELDAELPRISADRVQLQQVLLNLILNGVEAMKDIRGELIIKSQQDEEGRR